MTKIIFDKNIYFLNELNETSLLNIFAENRFKKFHSRSFEKFDSFFDIRDRSRVKIEDFIRDDHSFVSDVEKMTVDEIEKNINQLDQQLDYMNDRSDSENDDFQHLMFSNWSLVVVIFFIEFQIGV